jgi:hypothetical protein
MVDWADVFEVKNAFEVDSLDFIFTFCQGNLDKRCMIFVFSMGDVRRCAMRESYYPD